jgi:diguanylate cyclase (GGDEF)-like protein
MPDSPSGSLPALKFPEDDEVTGEIFALDRSTRPDIAFHQLGLGERMVPALSVVMGAMFGKVVRLETPELVVGRGEEAHLRIVDDGVSRRHARFLLTGDKVVVEDLGSRNGTFVNEVRVLTPVQLREGDRIRLGLLAQVLFGYQVELANLGPSPKDSLTGTHNRRSFEENLMAQWSRTILTHEPYGILAISIDQFEHHEAQLGKDAADRLIARVGKTVVASVRQEDLVARLGGERFAVIVLGVEKAADIAKRIRQGIEKQEFAGASHPVRVSIGIARSNDAGVVSPRTLVTRAEERMAVAASQGGNRTVF